MFIIFLIQICGGSVFSIIGWSVGLSACTTTYDNYTITISVVSDAALVVDRDGDTGGDNNDSVTILHFCSLHLRLCLLAIVVEGRNTAAGVL